MVLITRVLVVLVMSIIGCTGIFAQKQYWFAAIPGISPADPLYLGGIVRVDSNAMNPEIVIPFQLAAGVNGSSIGSTLLLATNGRLYGMSNAADGVPPYRGQLYWIDPVTDSLHVTVEFGTAQYPEFSQPLYRSSLMEVEPGLLIGHTSGNVARGTIFKYYTANDSIVKIITLPDSPSPNGPVPSSIQGTFFKASDGYLYGISPANPYKGENLVRINPALTSATYPSLNTSWEEGYGLNGNDIREHNDTLVFTTFRGGPDDGGFFGSPGRGTFWGFDINSSTDLPIKDFTDSIHNPTNGSVVGPDGYWYGEAAGPIWNEPPYDKLSLYHYEPASRTLTLAQLFGRAPFDASVTGVHNAPGLLAASNGRNYGSFRNGLWEYDPVSDTARLRAPLQYGSGPSFVGHGSNGALTEVCRKPNYKPRPTTSFNVCAGAHFFYDLRNVNATSVVWRRNGTVVPSQSNQRLEFDAISEGDEGVWTCTLTNECGVTEPPAISITVNAGSFTSSTISGDTLLCGTGDMATLIGNNGGTWNTGATSATVEVSQPGLYHITNTQACGLSMSDPVYVVHLDSAEAPYQLALNFLPGEFTICPGGDPFVFDLNSPGPWGNLPTGTWQDGSTGPTYTATDTGLVYVTATNACNTDTSGIYHLVPVPLPSLPPLIFTDAFGAADNFLCGADSVVLSAPLTAEYANSYQVLWNGQAFGYIAGGSFFPQSITLHEPGIYQVLSSDPCGGAADTLSFVVYQDDVPPNSANISPTDNPLIGCDQDTTYLSTDATSAYWTWFDGSGQQQVDSSLTVQVDWQSGLFTLTPFNGCGNGPSSSVFIQSKPTPVVQLSISLDSVCLNDGVQELSGGTPPGGTYSGPGVTGNTFNPAAAGIGEHSITYSYSDGDCTGFAQDVIAVDICQGMVAPAHGGSMVIHPNPTTGRFAMTLGSSGPATVTLHDATGSVVWLRSVNGPGPHALNVSELAGGNYAVRVEGPGTLAHGRLVLMP